MVPLRLAWFSPLPPVRSGIAAYSAELLPHLRRGLVIDLYPESEAHDFVWRQRRTPYDVVVYQLGNAPCHDYQWAYMARYPGLVVLHDAKLHHARARQLLQHQRVDDYRREFRYDHPTANPDFAEYAALGLGGSIYYFWPMLRVVMRTARLVCVHSRNVAADLRADYPEVRVETVRMGVPALPVAADARIAVRRRLNLPPEAIVFAAFGKVTAEKRIASILGALHATASEGFHVYLLLVGDADDYRVLSQQLEQYGVADRVRVTGHVADDAIADHLAAADACVCLRWPTAQESSASWLRCLAAARPTVRSDLAHLVDVPDSVALRVDLLDEERSLAAAMRTLAADPTARERIGRAGYEYWMANHTIEAMAEDYRRLLPIAATPAPAPTDLPAHFSEDHSDVATAILRQFEIEVDL